MEYIIGPIVALIVGAKFSMVMGNKAKAEAIESARKAYERLDVVEEQVIQLTIKMESTEKTVEIIDKQTLAKMVTTLQPVSGAIKEIQEFVGLK